jgi:Domain of unknown function (DU1801)
MAKNKTVRTAASVRQFLNAVADDTKKQDSLELVSIMKDQTGLEPYMWGPSIVGFGTYHYKYASGHEGDAPLVGFSPRKAAIVLYLAQEYEGKKELLNDFGKHKASVGCIYIKKLEDVDTAILRKMIDKSLEYHEKK